MNRMEADDRNSGIPASTTIEHGRNRQAVRDTTGNPEDCVVFCQMYFCEGQQLSVKASQEEGSPSWFMRNRRWLGPFIPALCVHVVWWSVFCTESMFDLFTARSTAPGIPNYYVSITMIFGSLVAGATSEGGGAVAFPVMTLALSIAPTVARDFTFMIQSVGMSAASMSLLLMRVQMEWRALMSCSIGGVVGMVMGLELISPNLSPPFAKMYFVSVFLTFAVALYLLNTQRNRRVYDEIPEWNTPSVVTFAGATMTVHWKAVALVMGGLVGGMFSAVGGSGLDIASFSMLTLLFRVSEKVATPTSIVLMAINSLVGFGYRELSGGVEGDAWPYFAVAAPVVCIGAPLGSMLGSHCHRLVLASFVYVLDAAQFVGALVVVRPWSTAKTDDPLLLSLSSLAVAVLGSLFFRVLAHTGARLFDHHPSPAPLDVPGGAAAGPAVGAGLNSGSIPPQEAFPRGVNAGIPSLQPGDQA